jgi:hypothetical protein
VHKTKIKRPRVIKNNILTFEQFCFLFCINQPVEYNGKNVTENFVCLAKILFNNKQKTFMKRKTIFTIFTLALLMGAGYKVSAQRHSGISSDYDNGAGLFIDFGNGGTLVGPHLKHYYDANNAGQLMLLFGNGSVLIGAEYSYNQTIPNAGGLKWNLGVGPQIEFGGGTTILVRPIAGLEYKVASAPIAFGLDWRPAWALTNGSGFEAARFGLALKFTF